MSTLSKMETHNNIISLMREDCISKCIGTEWKHTLVLVHEIFKTLNVYSLFENH